MRSVHIVPKVLIGLIAVTVAQAALAAKAVAVPVALVAVAPNYLQKKNNLTSVSYTSTASPAL